MGYEHGHRRRAARSEAHGCGGFRSPGVGEDVQSIGGVLGQWLEIGVGDLEDVDLDQSKRGRDLGAAGPLGVAPAATRSSS